jgi:hypothetical protein
VLFPLRSTLTGSWRQVFNRGSWNGNRLHKKTTELAELFFPFECTVDPGQTRTEILTLPPQLYNINSLNQDE